MVVRFRGSGRGALLLAVLLAACGGDDEGSREKPEAERVVDLVVDANRSGALEAGAADEDEAEDAWDASSGAIFLANLDDDDGDGMPDSHDEQLDGEADLKDLAPIEVRAWAEAPDGATAVLTLDERASENVRLFRVSDDSHVAVQAPVELTTEELRAGARFLVEGKNLVTSTDAEAWSGMVQLTLQVTDAGGTELGSDAAKLRVAPLLLQFNTAPTEAVYYSEGGLWTRLISNGIRDTVESSGLAPTGLLLPGTDEEWDPWTQDFFDIGYTSMPGPDGAPIGMKIAVRSAQPGRIAGSIVATHFAGPDWGTVFIYTPGLTEWDHGYSMNSFGNWEVVPPHSGPEGEFPLGRNVWGSAETAGERPDPAFVDFVEAQQVQPGIVVDTSWLVVGHTDEVFSWVETDTPRGWGMLVANPTLARQMLLDLQAAGHGSAGLFTGKTWIDWERGFEYSAEVTVDEVLLDEERMAASQEAQIRTDEMAAVLQEAVGLADEELTQIPFLYESLAGALVAYQPGTVNLLHVDGNVLVPKPFGPQVDGADVFEADLQSRLGSLGLTVHFVDNWDLYHRNLGEVHCGTNVSRRMDLRWWESGR